MRPQGQSDNSQLDFCAYQWNHVRVGESIILGPAATQSAHQSKLMRL